MIIGALLDIATLEKRCVWSTFCKKMFTPRYGHLNFSLFAKRCQVFRSCTPCWKPCESDRGPIPIATCIHPVRLHVCATAHASQFDTYAHTRLLRIHCAHALRQLLHALRQFRYVAYAQLCAIRLHVIMCHVSYRVRHLHPASVLAAACAVASSRLGILQKLWR